MFTSIRSLILAMSPVVLVGTSMAQYSSQTIELIEYTNDSLGFNIDLPCDPEWQKPSIPGSKAVLVCATSNPIVIIHMEQKSIKGDKALDNYVKKQVQVGDMTYEFTRHKLDGHKARRVRLSANDQDVELWVVAVGSDRLHTFTFVQPSGQAASALPGIVASIRLK